jgi:hypothetical protein
LYYLDGLREEFTLYSRKNMRLRWLILVGAAGLVAAWWCANLLAAYVTVFGCLVLYGQRVTQFHLESKITSLAKSATERRASADGHPQLQVLMLRRQKLIRKLNETNDAQNRNEFLLELIKIHEALRALGFEPVQNVGAAKTDVNCESLPLPDLPGRCIR